MSHFFFLCSKTVFLPNHQIDSRGLNRCLKIDGNCLLPMEMSSLYLGHISSLRQHIGGNAPSLMGRLKSETLSSMWCTAGDLNSLCGQNQPISGI